MASHLPSGTRSASRSSRTPRAGPCASLGHLKANAGVRPHWLSHRSRWTDADSVPLDDNYSDLGHLGNEPPGQERRCAASPRLRPAHDRPCLLPAPAPWRQAQPSAPAESGPHTPTHTDPKRTHSSPSACELDLVKADASHLSPRGPYGLVLSIPMSPQFTVPACACYQGAAVQPADSRGRGARFTSLGSQEKGSRSPKRPPLAVVAASPNRFPQGTALRPSPFRVTPTIATILPTGRRLLRGAQLLGPAGQRAQARERSRCQERT
ncbi:uncharacterized protein LOC120585895 isoform X2 [Pteropus medius]|uniref:uncharacterized protein LOC120585895 isoform X2 n=1 Tax=Pteropus vampyrus TaxID=132908 RepID=UPI00196A235F|nr:uncharacterized protein LOC120585895 isoform X2 [Pteropus giganteus]